MTTTKHEVRTLYIKLSLCSVAIVITIIASIIGLFVSIAGIFAVPAAGIIMTTLIILLDILMFRFLGRKVKALRGKVKELSNRSVKEPNEHIEWTDVDKKAITTIAIFVECVIIVLGLVAGIIVAFKDSATLGWVFLTIVLIITWVLISCLISKSILKSGKCCVITSGYEYERYVAAQLIKRGSVKAEVTKKSGDFGADVIVTDKDGTRMCVQCKQYSKPVGIKAVQEVIGAKAYYNCTRAAVITTATFTQAAKELAQKSGVELYENFYPKKKDDLDWIDRIEEIDSIIE